MHELSVVYPIVQMAARLARDNGIERVTCVRLAVGEIHDLVDEYVEYIEKALGKGNAYRMSIRPHGAICFSDMCR